MNTRRSSPALWICDLGVVPYREATQMQHEICARRLAGEFPDVMLLLEHPPTYTRGRRSGPGELPFPKDFYRERGIEVLATDRGGRVTYHGPGQLVGYPIMRVSDVVAHVRMIETALVAALADEGLRAHSRASEGPDYTGVWVSERKIASIGVHVSRGVTTHGFAINVDNDLGPFSWIVPCGLAGVAMTSIAREGAGDSPSIAGFRRHVTERFCEQLGRPARHVPAAALAIAAPVEAVPVPGSRAALVAQPGAAVHA
jgi:lipoyl(octanoyl) transferase